MADLKPPPSTATSIAPSTAPPRMESPIPDRHYNIERLTDGDHALVCHAIGGSVPNAEEHKIVHPTSIYYPPKGMITGLYRDVVHKRTVCQYAYRATATLVSSSMLLQLLIGATLTALGSKSTGQEIPITILAAANTVVAGILALMHNSGIPDRFQKDLEEFDKVESFLREVMETGIVKKGMSKDEVIENCFARFRRAKEVVSGNKPTSYTGSGTTASAHPETAPPASAPSHL